MLGRKYLLIIVVGLAVALGLAYKVKTDKASATPSEPNWVVDQSDWPTIKNTEVAPKIEKREEPKESPKPPQREFQPRQFSPG